MLGTSKDVLYIVLSFCIIWLTVFLCWILYYAGKILKDASQIVEEFRLRLQLLTEAIGYIRGKVESISSLLTLATEGAAGLAKKFVAKKATEWTEDAVEKTGYVSTNFDRAAKDAVDKAVSATAKKMRHMAKEMKK